MTNFLPDSQEWNTVWVLGSLIRFISFFLGVFSVFICLCVTCILNKKLQTIVFGFWSLWFLPSLDLCNILVPSFNLILYTNSQNNKKRSIYAFLISIFVDGFFWIEQVNSVMCANNAPTSLKHIMTLFSDKKWQS